MKSGTTNIVISTRLPRNGRSIASARACRGRARSRRPSPRTTPSATATRARRGLASCRRSCPGRPTGGRPDREVVLDERHPEREHEREDRQGDDDRDRRRDQDPPDVAVEPGGRGPPPHRRFGACRHVTVPRSDLDRLTALPDRVLARRARVQEEEAVRGTLLLDTEPVRDAVPLRRGLVEPRLRTSLPA